MTVKKELSDSDITGPRVLTDEEMRCAAGGWHCSPSAERATQDAWLGGIRSVLNGNWGDFLFDDSPAMGASCQVWR